MNDNKKNLEELIPDIEVEINNFRTDAKANLLKGSKAAGVRARKASLALTKLFKEYRELTLKIEKE